MRRALILVALLVLAVVTPGVARAEDAPGGPGSAAKAVRLRDAVEAGLVSVASKASRTYRQLTIELTSRAAERRTIDLAGAHFEPEGGTCQRLGIGPAVTASAKSGNGDGSTRVDVDPGATVSVTVATCCLDLSRNVPSEQTMRLGRKPLPAKLEALFRRWADHPRTPQSVVNSAVWQGVWDLDAFPEPATERDLDALVPKGTYVRARGGVVYLLRDGDLRARGPDGNVRLLGTGVWTVLPEDEGVWVVAQDPRGGRRVWRVPVTAEESPASLCALDSDESVDRVLPFGRGTALVGLPPVRSVAPDGTVSDVTVLDGGVRSCAIDEKGRLLLVVEGARSGAGQGRFRLVTIDPASLARKDGDRFTNVRDLCVLPCGAFALSDDGFLQRVRLSDGRRFDVDRTRRGRVVIGGSPQALWTDVEGPSGPVACDPATGKLLATVPAEEQGLETTFHADPVTGDLVWVKGERVRRFVLAEGRIEDVEFAPK